MMRIVYIYAAIVWCVGCAVVGAEECSGVAADDMDMEPQELLPVFSAEVLFPDALLTSLERDEAIPVQDERLKQTQALLREVKAIECNGKNINHADRSGRTALMFAAQLGDRLVVSYLVAKGADVRLKDRAGRTAADMAIDPCSRELLLACMDEACELDDSEIKELDSIVGNADEDIRARLWESVNYPENVCELAQLLKYGVDASGFYRDRLIIESFSLQPECLAYLVRHGYDVNTRRKDGKSAFCSVSREVNVRLLLALGMQQDADDASQRALLWRVLHTNSASAPLAAEDPACSWKDAPLPRVEVYFDRAREVDLPSDQRHTSLGASGFLFTGRMELWDENGECVVSQDVQSGGWMSFNSPFRRAGNYPRARAYNPREYPDTAFPVLSEVTSMDTVRTTALNGYHIPDPPGTGRSGLMVHSSERLGSEGCISTSGGVKWAVFCGKMDHFRSLGFDNIPLRVIYLCNPPEPTRCAEQAATPDPPHRPTRRRHRRRR